MNQQHQQIPIPTIAKDPSYLPVYSSADASGADLKAYLSEPMTIKANATALIPTGITLAIPHGYEIQVRPRSGLAVKHQLTVLNTPGTIDADYRGEIQVILINHGNKDFIVEPGMRIAQAVLSPVFQGEFILKKELQETSRGAGGFGHTGTH